MKEPGDAPRHGASNAPETVRYPTNHVVGVVTSDEVAPVVGALTDAGFASSEIVIGCGAAAADNLRASTGHTGLTNLAIRIADRLGVRDEEMSIKDNYEKELRHGHVVVSVPAADVAQKKLAANVMREHGGHFINYLGRFTIESNPR